MWGDEERGDGEGLGKEGGGAWEGLKSETIFQAVEKENLGIRYSSINLFFLSLFTFFLLLCAPLVSGSHLGLGPVLIFIKYVYFMINVVFVEIVTIVERIYQKKKRLLLKE